MYVMGVDLSGPSNVADTAWVALQCTEDELILREWSDLGTDAEILSAATRLALKGPLLVGLDAPLSYNPGGGLRPADRALREALKEVGMGGRMVMPPTMTRMAYLTLRGISVARMLETIQEDRPVIYEVHPGACLALRGAPPELIQGMKKRVSARKGLAAWLEEQGMRGIPSHPGLSDHVLAACACAYAVWQVERGNDVWSAPASPPFHPYDYVC